jgi:uncharacterized protein YbjT (DUF2867 family)
MVKQPILALPARASMSPVDSDEFADYVLDCLGGRWLGEPEDFAGPQTLTMIELLQEYLNAQGLRRRVRHAPVPDKIQAALTAGNTSVNARRGSTTWAQWLRRPSAAPRLGGQTSPQRAEMRLESPTRQRK